MPPPREAEKSRQTRAMRLAAASEIWLPSNTFAAPLPPTTHSGFDTFVFGVVWVANLGTGVGLAGGGGGGRGGDPGGGAGGGGGGGGCGRGRSSMSGATFEAPSPSASPCGRRSRRSTPAR